MNTTQQQDGSVHQGVSDAAGPSAASEDAGVTADAIASTLCDTPSPDANDAPIELTFDEAVKLLPERDSIHTFRNPRAGMMLGADWNRDALLAAIKASPSIQVTGPHAQAAGHGLAISHDGLLFIEAAEYKEAA